MNITTSLAELQAYLRRLGDIHPDIKQVIIGDSQQIISLDRSKLNYPLLWIETPTVDWYFDNNPNRFYNFSFVVLRNTTVENWQHKEYVLHQSLLITEQLLSKMRSDADENLIHFRDGSAKSSPVLGYGHDNDYGYRTTLRIRAYMNSCADDCVWADPCPVGAMAQFSWQNNSPGDFTDISFAHTSLPTTATYSESWTWQIDGGEVTTDTSPPPSNLGAGNYLFVTLTITSGECSLVASNMIYAHQKCGTSVPSLLDPKNC